MPTRGRRCSIERLERRMLLSLSPAGGEFRLNTFTVGSQTNPAVAVDGDGDYAVAWQSFGQDGSFDGIYLRMARRDGTGDSFELRVNSHTSASQSQPAIARDADGDFVVVWQSAGQDGSNGGIYGQRFRFTLDNALGRVGNEFPINQFTPNEQGWPVVGMDAAGNFVVAWHSDGPDGSGFGISARRFNANGVALGDEFLVNTYTTNHQLWPSIAVGARGEFVVAWTNTGLADPAARDIHAQRFDASGAPQGSEFRVNSFTTGDQDFPAVAMDFNGNFVIAWESELQDGAGEGVYAQRYNAAGVPQGGEFRVNVTTASHQNNPAVAMDARGNFTVSWNGVVGGNNDVFVRSYDASGAALGGELRVNTFTPANQGLPKVAMSHDGEVAVVWYSDGQDGSGHGIYGQRYYPQAPPAGGEFRVNTFTQNSQNEHRIASDAKGNSVVVWHSIDQDGSEGEIYAQRYNAAGVPQGGEFRVNTFTTGSQRLPGVAMDADGDFVVTWQSFAQDGSIYGIYAQRFDAAGAPQGTEFRVNTFTTGQQINATVGMNAGGDFVVAWESNQDGSVGSIYAQRYDAAGVPQGSEFRVNTFTTGSQYKASVYVRDDASFVVAWGGGPITNADVFFQRYNSAGAAVGPEQRVNSFTPGIQHQPSIAGDALGNFIVTWTSLLQDGTDASVYMQRFTPTGAFLGGEMRVNQFTTGRQWLPEIDMNADGQFVITWESDAQDGSGWGIFARQGLGDEFRVNSFTTGHQRIPDVAIDADGDFVAAWYSYQQDGSAYGVYAQRFARAHAGPVVGEVLSDEQRVEPAQRLAHHPFRLMFTFSEAMSRAGGTTGANSATNPANYALARNGVDVSSVITFAFAQTSEYPGNIRQRILLSLDGILPDGNYVLTAKESIHDVAGNALDGDLDGAPGGDFSIAFTVAVPQQMGPEFQVNTFTLNAQHFPAIASDAAGNFVVAWGSAGGQDGDGAGVFAQRYNAAGVPQGGEFLVNTYTTSAQDRPAVAMDPAGNFVITWQSLGQDGSSYGVYAQRYNAAGVPQGGEFRVNAFTTNDQSRPDVAMDADGDFIIAWQSSGQIGQGNEVYARRYSAAGAPLGNEFLVNGSTVGHQDLPGVAMNAAGEFVITWTSGPTTIPDPQIDDIYARCYNAAGLPVGFEFLVNDFTAGDQFASSVAMDAEGKFVIAWVSNIQDSAPTPSDGIVARRFDAAGRPLGFSFIVNDFTTGNQFAPSVAMSRSGEFVIVWNSRGQETPGLELGVFGRRYNAAGESDFFPDFRVNTFTTGDQRAPAVAMNAEGDFVVAWQSLGQDGSAEGIFAQRYASDAAPEILASSFQYLAAPHRLVFTFDQDVSASLGIEDLVVENLTTNQSIPPGQLSLTYDSATNTATVTYTGSGGGLPGVLPDGSYRATLLPAGITNPSGTPLSQPHVLHFFFLNGDANRDGRVNLADFNILAANFGQINRTFSQGDFTYDGLVNLADFNVLASRFGTILDASGPAGRPPALFGSRSINPSGDVEDQEDAAGDLLA